jgi:surfactin synthase thioesterase subunit
VLDEIETARLVRNRERAPVDHVIVTGGSAPTTHLERSPHSESASQVPELMTICGGTQEPDYAARWPSFLRAAVRCGTPRRRAGVRHRERWCCRAAGQMEACWTVTPAALEGDRPIAPKRWSDA